MQETQPTVAQPVVPSVTPQVSVNEPAAATQTPPVPTQASTPAPTPTPEPPKKSNTGLIIAVVVLVILVLAAAGYYAYKTYFAKNASSLYSPTPIASAVPSSSPTESASPSGNVSGMIQYTNTRPAYSLSYPSDWTIDSSKAVAIDPASASGTTLKISNGGYSFVTYQPAAWGPGMCTYPDSQGAQGPSQAFTDFVEITSGTHTYRRPKTPTASPDVTGVKWTVCEKGPGGIFSNNTWLSLIYYQSPQNYDQKMITAMDNILTSLK